MSNSSSFVREDEAGPLSIRSDIFNECGQGEPMKTLLRSLFPVIFLALSSAAFGQLEPCLDAHGGLSKWRSYGSVEYRSDVDLAERRQK